LGLAALYTIGGIWLGPGWGVLGLAEPAVSP